MSASVSIAMAEWRRPTRARYMMLAAVSVRLAADAVEGGSDNRPSAVPAKRNARGSRVNPAVAPVPHHATPQAPGHTPALFVAGIVWVSTRVPAPRIVHRCACRVLDGQAGPVDGSGLGVILLLLRPRGPGLARKRSQCSRLGAGGGRASSTDPQSAIGATHSSDAPSTHARRRDDDGCRVRGRRSRRSEQSRRFDAARKGSPSGDLSSSASPSMTACR